MISSPCSRTVSRSGLSPGSRWKSVTGTVRSLSSGPRSRTAASRAARATAMSEGCVATQCAEWPSTARSRCTPSRAGQPVPGSRLLHGLPTSWK
ncbi:hypothetical protein ADK38_05540 [Streptomyces varsoviensis]|uniref:Uncharacterized protein n=1 Tax=Streptomyces varsoviensis TaxID=67373 RepID=A0ABR5JC32_9ACTN|nr:hypothetical protein ADK38_05540 [Streptomyces varsoviensis]